MDKFVMILGYVLTPVTGVVTWFATRKKRKTEEIDAAYDTWNKIVQSLRGQIETLLENNRKLQEKIDNMNAEIELLREEVVKLKSHSQNKELIYLRKKVKEYERRIK